MTSRKGGGEDEEDKKEQTFSKHCDGKEILRYSELMFSIDDEA